MTHVFKHPKYWREMRKERQASSSKLQAPSANELDRDPELGYNRINKTKPPLKVSAMSAVSKAGAFRAVSRRIHAGRQSLPRANCGAVNLPGCEFSTTSTHPKPQSTRNQQASKVSSTVDQDPRAIDEQAKPSFKSS